MAAEGVRSRTVGCKVTDSQYAKLAAVAAQRGQTLGEWGRAVLLERADGRPPSVAEESLLAEVLALRTVLVNLFYRLVAGEAITAEAMQQILARADADKLNKARERLAVAAGGER